MRHLRALDSDNTKQDDNKSPKIIAQKLKTWKERRDDSNHTSRYRVCHTCSHSCNWDRLAISSSREITARKIERPSIAAISGEVSTGQFMVFLRKRGKPKKLHGVERTCERKRSHFFFHQFLCCLWIDNINNPAQAQHPETTPICIGPKERNRWNRET